MGARESRQSCVGTSQRCRPRCPAPTSRAWSSDDLGAKKAPTANVPKNSGLQTILSWSVSMPQKAYSTSFSVSGGSKAVAALRNVARSMQGSPWTEVSALQAAGSAAPIRCLSAQTSEGVAPLGRPGGGAATEHCPSPLSTKSCPTTPEPPPRPMGGRFALCVWRLRRSSPDLSSTRPNWPSWRPIR